jgi:tripartite-type tricarboxylate transporter receptor subunit TctC
MRPILAASGALLLAVSALDAAAQSYPNRPVRVIFAQSAGSSLDTLGRIVTTKLTETMGQQFVVDNRGGAAGTIGAELAARATPDGYTLLLGASSSLIVSRYTYRKLAFDAFKDFDPISLIVNTDSVVAVHPSVQVKTVKDLIALAKAQPGKLNMASAGIGSSSHLAGTMFTAMTGINSVHIPYKGGGPMAAAVVANESQWVIAPVAAIAGHIRAGRLRGVAIASKTRSPQLPELPTIAESGVPEYAYFSWSGMFAPRGTPKPIIQTLHGALQKTLAAPDLKEQFANQGAAPLGSESPEAFARFFRGDSERLEPLIKLAGIKPE